MATEITPNAGAAPALDAPASAVELVIGGMTCASCAT